MPPHPAPPTIWMISGPVLCLYGAAAAIVLLLCEINDRVGSVSSNDKPLSPAAIAALCLASNLLGIASLVMLAKALSSSARLSMLALPLLLLILRYGMMLRREPQKWRSPASALAGSVAGLGLGAWLLMRQISAAEPMGHTTVRGDVRTMRLSELLKNEGTWTITLQLVVFYLVSLSIFFALHALLKKTAQKQMAGPEPKLLQKAMLLVPISLALNFAGVAALIFLADSAQVQTRLAMVALPLLLIAESYVGLIRAEPANRPAHWSGLIGSSAGMALAAFFLLRGAPLH